jgi:hypothetical protein
LEDPGVDGRIISKCVFKNGDVEGEGDVDYIDLA